MDTEKTIVNIKKLARAFDKIYKGIAQNQLDELNKELLKIHPTDDSEVLLFADYDEEENSMGLSIYVSNPDTDEELEALSFDKLMFEYLLLADITKLSNVWECIELMERSEGEDYDMDFIPVFYTKEIDKYDLHIRITKK